MDIRDLLANGVGEIPERSTVYYDGTNRVWYEIPANIWTCLDVTGCIDWTFLATVLDLHPSLTTALSGDLEIDITWLNNNINVVWASPDLTVGDKVVSLVDFLDDLSLTFRDHKFNSFNIAGSYQLMVEGLDGLDFITNGVDTLQIGLPVPDAQYFSDSGVSGPSPQLPGTYQPFNHRLVLTWNDCEKGAYWAPPQCCEQSLSFTGDRLCITGGGHQDTGSSCSCSGCTPNGGTPFYGGNMGNGICVDLSAINTDNQTLSYDEGTGDLSLTTCVGTTLGQCTPGPDSVVNLNDINEHTLSLMSHNTLFLHGSEGGINSAIDLTNIGPHDLQFNNTTNVLSIHNDDGTLMDSVDLSGVNNQTLSWMNGGLHVSGDTNCCGPRRVQFRKPVQFCSDVLGCLCSAQYTRAQWEAMGVIPPANWTVPNDPGNWAPGMAVPTTALLPQRWADRGRAMPTTYPDGGWDEFLDSNPSICDMLNWIAMVLGANLASNNYIRTEGDVVYNDNDETNIYVDNSTNLYNGSIYEVNNYNIGIINNLIENASRLIEKTKYRARIYNTDNRVMRSRNDGASGGIFARRYFPNMDGGDGWESATTSLAPVIRMLEPTNFIADNLDTLDLGAGGTHNMTIAGGYTTTMSANNPEAANDGKLSNGGSQTITIPFTGMYEVSLNAEVQVDHNVHAYRVSVLRYNPSRPAVEQIKSVLDTKFGGGDGAGSKSVNNVAYPITNQYTNSGSKILYLEQGDILFVGVRIDPSTYRPKDIPQQWLDSEAGSGPTHPYRANLVYSYTPGSYSPGYGSYTPGSFSAYFDYPDGVLTPAGYDGTLHLVWPTPGAPDLVNPYYWAAAGGINGAGAYGYNLEFPAMDQGFWNDDGVIRLLGPTSIYNPALGGGGEVYTEPQGGSMLTVVYMNKYYAAAP